jgi:hypothetical protein
MKFKACLKQIHTIKILLSPKFFHKLNVKHINGGKMKRANAIYLMISFFLLLLITNCKEELVVESKKENIQPSQSNLAKENVSLSIVADSLSKKEKVAKLKKEHEKPYVVIDKPEKLLADKLKSRSTYKPLSKSSNNPGSYSVQSTQSCYTIEIDVWALSKYEAKSNVEFGILPHRNRQYAGGSGDPNRIQKLNELKSKWGFNYIMASIGNYNDIMAIVNAGFPIATNYMASGFLDGGQMDRETVENQSNGLSPNAYFWAYFFDEPYSHTDYPHLTQSSFKSFRDFVKNLRPNSLFGFGETNVYTANRYTHNPYFWYTQYYTNYYPTSVDFVMCTRYVGYYGEADQRNLWTELKTSYDSKFSRTWIAANLDRSEFNSLLGHAKNNGAAPWFYQLDDYEDNSDIIISE